MSSHIFYLIISLCSVFYFLPSYFFILLFLILLGSRPKLRPNFQPNSGPNSAQSSLEQLTNPGPAQVSKLAKPANLHQAQHAWPIPAFPLPRTAHEPQLPAYTRQAHPRGLSPTRSLQTFHSPSYDKVSSSLYELITPTCMA